MNRLDRQALTLAVLLSAQAGFVDALGFIELGGFFVSFMSGNSTRLAVGIGSDRNDAALAGMLILTFVMGVFTATLLRNAVRHHWQKPLSLAFLTATLLMAASAHTLGATSLALFAMAFAMGTENMVFEREGEVAVGLTYMTGALVKLGQKLAHALTGRGEPRAWLPFLGLWGGLMAGAVAGALAHPLFGLDALWAAVALSLLLTIWRARAAAAA